MNYYTSEVVRRFEKTKASIYRNKAKYAGDMNKLAYWRAVEMRLTFGEKLLEAMLTEYRMRSGKLRAAFGPWGWASAPDLSIWY